MGVGAVLHSHSQWPVVLPLAPLSHGDLTAAQAQQLPQCDSSAE